MGQTTETTDRTENLKRVFDEDQQSTVRVTTRGVLAALANGDLETALYDLETLAKAFKEMQEHLDSLDG